ncbi:MAG: aldehyde dehydrogenase family protein [Pseudomonadota bacterium]
MVSTPSSNAIAPAEKTGRHLIGASWENGDDRHREIISPATGQVIGSIPLADAAMVDRAVIAARPAAPFLRRLSRQDRAYYLRRVADIMDARADALSHLVTLEQGKPIAQAEGEVAASALALRMAADYILTVETPSPPLLDPMKRAFIELKPRGVYGIITPWNFPIATACCYYLGPGLAAGNALIWVPAPTTSLAATALVECFLEADPPVEGMVNLVLGDGPDAGDALVTHNGVDALAFTGSTETGRIISSRAGPKSVSLELGGNGPTIVFEDADIERAAARSAVAAFTNAGQICTSTERVLVQKGVYEEFVERATREAEAMRLGDPFDQDTTIGPLHNEATAKKVAAHISDAVKGGGRTTFGGARASGFPTDLYFQPTVIADVPPDSALHCEETFGPVIPILPFEDEESLHALISKSNYGLFGSVFTRSMGRAMGLINDLKVGVLNINEMSAYWEPGMPGSGASGTLSGTGRIGIGPSILSMSDQVTVTMDLN